VEAIFPDHELPAQWSEYTEINRTFFVEVTDLGNPGGASHVPPQTVDHPVVAALAPREPIAE
jgi:hypothetical protein